MEQRTAEYSSLPLVAFVTMIKNLKIPVVYVKDEGEGWSCWTEYDTIGPINTYGIGDTLDEAIDDYLDALKEIAECIYEDNLPDKYTSAEYLAKILMSSKEELRQCLNGRISEDS